MKKKLTNDISLASKTGIKFTICKKETTDKSWTQLSDVLDLQDAIENALSMQNEDLGIFTTTGYLYWTNQAPDTYNSEVLTVVKPQGKNDILSWTVFLKAKKEKSANNLLQKISKLLGTKLTHQTLKKANEPSYYEAYFSTKLTVKSPYEALFSSLCIASILASSWETSGVCIYDGGWSFSARSGKISISGVDFMEFHYEHQDEIDMYL